MAGRKRKGERPDGLIQVSLQIGYKDDGRPARKYFYGHSRAEAERKRDEYKARLASGFSLDVNMTVSQWIDIFLRTYRSRVNEAYLKSDERPYRRLEAVLGRMRLLDVRESHLQDALNDVSGMSFSTVDKYRQAIQRLFERARKNKLIADNPAADLIMPPFVKGSHRALERWEIELILDNWNTKASHAGLWMMLMLLCGLRRGEMMALTWDAVDLVNRTLEVRRVAVIRKNRVKIEERAKTDAGLRTLPLCKVLCDALLTVPEEKRIGYVCLSAKGLPLTESAYERGAETFCRVLERILNGEPPTQRGRRTDVERKKAEKGPPAQGAESVLVHCARSSSHIRDGPLRRRCACEGRAVFPRPCRHKDNTRTLYASIQGTRINLCLSSGKTHANTWLPILQ